MVKRKSIKRKSIVKQKQKQTQIVNINLAKPKRKGKGKTPKRLISTAYIRYPEFIPPAFNYPAQTSLIPPPAKAPTNAFPSQLGEALVNVPAASLLAGLTVAPRLATAATTATGSILLSAINASPNIITGIGSAIRQSFTLPVRERIIIQPPEEEILVPRVERVNPFQRYADEEIQRLLNRDLGLIQREREGEDIATDEEEEAPLRRQPLASAPPAPETVFAEPVVVDEFFDLPEEEEEPALAVPVPLASLAPVPADTDPFNLETPPQTNFQQRVEKLRGIAVQQSQNEGLLDLPNSPQSLSAARLLASAPELLPYTAPQFEELRQQTALATSLDPSQFPLLGAPYVEPLGTPVIETDEPLTQSLAVPSLISSPPIELVGFGKPVTQGFFGEVRPPAVEGPKRGRPKGSTNKPKEVPTAPLLSFFPLLQNVEPASIPFQTAVKGEPPKNELERVRPEEVKEAEVIPFSSFGN